MVEKYKLEISSFELSIKPYFAYLTKIKWFAAISITLACAIPFVKDKVNYDVWTMGYVITGILAFYVVYDFLFNANVKFLFDKNTKSIYKINLFFKRRLMSFEEMTILTTSEYGAFTYAIGRKKKQFLKNYSISDTFTNSKKSKQREEEYVAEILNPILKFVEK